MSPKKSVTLKMGGRTSQKAFPVGDWERGINKD